MHANSITACMETAIANMKYYEQRFGNFKDNGQNDAYCMYVHSKSF